MLLSYHWFGKSPIIGCEGTGLGHLYSHRRQPMERFSNVVLGTRSFTEGNIEGHRGTTIFYRGSLLKHQYLRDMTIFRGNKRDYPRGACVWIVCLFACILFLNFRLSTCWLYLAIYNLITSIYESNKNAENKCPMLLHVFGGWGIQVYKWGL